MQIWKVTNIIIPKIISPKNLTKELQNIFLSQLSPKDLIIKGTWKINTFKDILNIQMPDYIYQIYNKFLSELVRNINNS